MIAIAIVVAVLVWIGFAARRRIRISSPEKQLARMLDPATAERLIRWEMLRDASLNRAQAAQRALERAEYDRGR